jgi:hypothetical protein
MKNFLEKIAATDFRKPVKRLVVITLIVVLACGALNGYLFRTQISEIAALKSSESQSVQVTEAHSDRDGDRETHGHEQEEADLFDSGLVMRPSAAAVGVGIASIVLCSLCALAYWLLVAAWLYKASVKAKMNRALWTILGLLTNLIAVLAFLIVRGRMTHCPLCGAWQKPAPYCGACGARLQRICPSCGRICTISEDFCPNCGTALTENNQTEDDHA